MTEDIDAKTLLDFYISSGVCETCGDSPYKCNSSVCDNSSSPSVLSTISRPATTTLAVSTENSLKSAETLCKDITSLDELKSAIQNFEGCALKNTATNSVIGDGNPQSKIMFIGEAPGAEEDRIGKAFVGRSGHLLDKIFASVGLSRDTCYICNILPWRPPGNRTPSDQEIAVCLPFLKKQIDLINPDCIFTLGAIAANSLLNSNESISRLRGKTLEYTNSNNKQIKIIASYHPAYLLRTPSQKSKVWADFLRLKKYLEQNN